MGRSVNYSSPSTKIRNLRRSIQFLATKILPASKANLSIAVLPTVEILLSASSKPTQILSYCKNQAISIQPRQIYHPAIIKACIAMQGKHPSQLTAEEAHKFNFYRQYKLKNGEPIEEDIIYLPSGGMKNCLQCGHLT